MSSQQNLFVDGGSAGAPDAGRGLVVHAKSSRPLDRRQRAFNRLLARVEALRAQREHQKRRLEEALVFHAAHLAPRAREALRLRTQFVRGLRPFLHDRRLKAGDRRVLADVVARQVEWILEREDAPEPDIGDLFEELHGISLGDVEQEQFDAARADMEDFFASAGLDVEIPELRAGMTPEDMVASAAGLVEEVQRSIDEAAARERAPGRRMTRRERREEEQARRIAEARRNSIGAIYRRLAKALHPDLERDPVQRERRSALMQQVTAAHAANDLHTLLRLEVELVHGDAGDVTKLAAETLDAYTQMLKQQVAELEAEEVELLLHPKYQPIVAMGPLGPVGVIDGEAEEQRLAALITDLQGSLELLSRSNALSEVRALIRFEREMRRRDAPAWAGAPTRRAVRRGRQEGSKRSRR